MLRQQVFRKETYSTAVDMNSLSYEALSLAHPSFSFVNAHKSSCSKGFDLNTLIVKNPLSTFMMRANTPFMTQAGIFLGDLLTVDQSLRPSTGKVIACFFNHRLAIRRFEESKKEIYLRLDDLPQKVETISTKNKFKVLSVVTYVVHPL